MVAATLAVTSSSSAQPPAATSTARSTEAPTAASCADDWDGLVAEPVPVAKAGDGQTVRAWVRWGRHPATGVRYLTLDESAAVALRAWATDLDRRPLWKPPPGPTTKLKSMSVGGHEGIHACGLEKAARAVCWGAD